jgi:hypothetical protein
MVGVGGRVKVAVGFAVGTLVGSNVAVEGKKVDSVGWVTTGEPHAVNTKTRNMLINKFFFIISLQGIKYIVYCLDVVLDIHTGQSMD